MCSLLSLFMLVLVRLKDMHISYFPFARTSWPRSGLVLDRSCQLDRGLYTGPPIPCKVHMDSTDSVDRLSTGHRLYTDQVLVHVLLNRQSMSELSLNRIRPNHEDCTDSQTKHGQTPYGLHTAQSVVELGHCTVTYY
jgi:hypothetical protein